MQDLGTLGGTLGFLNWLNNRGEAVGQSNLAGDQTYHPFLWDGRSLQDLGTLGGDFGSANWITDSGAAAGWATTPGNAAFHAVLWRDGATRDLGVPPGDAFSFGSSTNAPGQVVGIAGSCGTGGCDLHGFLWQDGAIADLNTLVAPSDLHVIEGSYINDLGEIAANAELNGVQRAALLVPAQLAAREGITSNAPAPSAAGPAAAPRASAAPCANVDARRTRMAPWRAWLAHRYQLPCLAG
jgi:probable HAF family extracellular repeat protein